MASSSKPTTKNAPAKSKTTTKSAAAPSTKTAAASATPSTKTATTAKAKTTAKAPKAVETPKADEAPKAVEPPKEAEVVDEVVASSDSTLGSQFNEFLAKLQLVATSISSLKNEFRVLEKRCNREFKIAQKESAKNKRRQGNRKPTGFIKPALISNELASFLGKPEGTEMARTDVTKEINSYIIAHDLQDPKCRRTILADGPLRTLLKLGDKDELTYFNLQTYMRSHFPKPAVPPATAAV